MDKLSVFLKALGEWVLSILEELKNHTIAVVIIGILFVLLWQFPQTRDLLLVLNQPTKYHMGEMILFFSSLSVLAFLISNVNDYFYGTSGSFIPRDDVEEAIRNNREVEYRKDETEDNKKYIRRMLPKVLGTFLLLITAFSVDNIGFTISGNMNNLFLNIVFVVLSVLLVLSLHYKFTRWFMNLFAGISGIKYVPIILAIGCLLTILLFTFFNAGGSVWDVRRLFIALLLLALFFFIVSVSYSIYILKFKEIIGARIIGFIAFIAFLTYIIFLFNPKLAYLINPLSVILISMIGIFTVANLIRYIGKKILKIPLLTLSVLFFIVLGSITANRQDFSHYEVSTAITHKAPQERPEIEEYIISWIEDRKEYINTTEKYPVIFVAAEGGGSRAGLWSLLVNSNLYEINKDYYDKYLFAMTGASGGSVGNSIFYTSAYQSFSSAKKFNFKLNSDIKSTFSYKGSAFYQGNFLSSSVASLLGRDLFASISGISFFNDRGSILENEWEEKYKTIFQNDSLDLLSKSFLSLDMQSKSTKHTPPALIINTTHLQSGNHSSISPVVLKDKQLETAITRDFLDDYRRAYKSDTTSIKISTAMLLNARFPYVSPVGRVKNIGQFGDAGYYDNIGGNLTIRLVNAFQKVVNQRYCHLSEVLDPRVLIIMNTSEKKTKTKDTVNYSTQLQAPLNVVVNATFAHPNELINTYGSEYLIASKRTKIPRPEEVDGVSLYFGSRETIKPILPLGRYLSDAAILSLEMRLKDSIVQDRMKKLLMPQ